MPPKRILGIDIPSVTRYLRFYENYGITSYISLGASVLSKKRDVQFSLFPKSSLSCGGLFRNTRRGRGARALAVKHSMHLVLRSSKAKGAWSFVRPEHEGKIKALVQKHAAKNFIQVLSLANVGNHLHLHIKLPHRKAYFPFIRAITGGIALLVMKANKHTKVVKEYKDRFWDYRPFTRVITNFKHFLNIKDYLAINRFEGRGALRLEARLLLAQEKDRRLGPYPGD